MILKDKIAFWSDVLLIALILPIVIAGLAVLCAAVAVLRWLGLLDEDEGL